MNKEQPTDEMVKFVNEMLEFPAQEPTTTYGKTVTWTDATGGVNSTSVDGCPTPEDAELKVRDLAIACGWTPPRWWQWWRWGDTRDV